MSYLMELVLCAFVGFFALLFVLFGLSPSLRGEFLSVMNLSSVFAFFFIGFIALALILGWLGRRGSPQGQ